MFQMWKRRRNGVNMLWQDKKKGLILMQNEQELIRKETQVKAQEEINAIRESYQNKLYQMMMEEKKKAK